MERPYSIRAPFVIAAIVLCGLLSACSGGGGGSGGGSGGSGGSGGGVVPTATFTVTGSLTDGGAAINGAMVTIGALPASSCTGWVGCGSPISPVLATTTAADGTFTVANLVNGTYMLTISKDAAPTTAQTYAILHRQITIASANLALGSVKIVQLSADERAWIAKLNSDRATVSVPATSPIVIDEYAEEQARQWATDIESGKTLYNDPGFGPYEAGYGSSSGAMYSPSHAGALNVNWQAAENASPQSWFAEKSNCPNGNWSTCPGSSTTSHYIVLSNSNDIWIGLGENLANTYVDSNGNHWNAFDAIIVYK